MKKLHEMKRAWVWKQKGVFYTATLHRNTLIVRHANTQIVILIISGLTPTTQSHLINNFHKVMKEMI